MNDQGERFTAVVHLPEKFFSFDLITPSDLITTSATAELNLAQSEAKRLLRDGSRVALLSSGLINSIALRRHIDDTEPFPSLLYNPSSTPTTSMILADETLTK
jgi:hypothetical protein